MNKYSILKTAANVAGLLTISFVVSAWPGASVASAQEVAPGPTAAPTAGRQNAQEIQGVQAVQDIQERRVEANSEKALRRWGNYVPYEFDAASATKELFRKEIAPDCQVVVTKRMLVMPPQYRKQLAESSRQAEDKMVLRPYAITVSLLVTGQAAPVQLLRTQRLSWMDRDDAGEIGEIGMLDAAALPGSGGRLNILLLYLNGTVKATILKPDSDGLYSVAQATDLETNNFNVADYAMQGHIAPSVDGSAVVQLVHAKIPTSSQEAASKRVPPLTVYYMRPSAQGGDAFEWVGRPDNYKGIGSARERAKTPSGTANPGTP